MHVSYLTLIAGVHRAIRVTLTVDFTLLQVTLVSGFSVAGITTGGPLDVFVFTKRTYEGYE